MLSGLADMAIPNMFDNGITVYVKTCHVYNHHMHAKVEGVLDAESSMSAQSLMACLLQASPQACS